MSPLVFHKMQAAGNDFVLLDLLAHPEMAGAPFPQVAIEACERRLGAGSDGLLTVEPPTADGTAAGAAVRMRMWNPDGTEDMCGNGLRCVAEHAWRSGHVKTAAFAVETLAGIRRVELLDQNLVRAAMGVPEWEPEAIPMKPPAAWDKAVGYSLAVDGLEIPDVTSVSTGSTHTVIFLNRELDGGIFERLSPKLEYHPWFPERTTILWAVPAGTNQFRLRIWERGVGETLACGTGACAVAAAARVTGRADGKTTLLCRGGTLVAEWEPGGEIYLTGPARVVYSGRWVPGVSG